MLSKTVAVGQQNGMAFDMAERRLGAQDRSPSIVLNSPSLGRTRNANPRSCRRRRVLPDHGVRARAKRVPEPPDPLHRPVSPGRLERRAVPPARAEALRAP